LSLSTRMPPMKSRAARRGPGVDSRAGGCGGRLAATSPASHDFRRALFCGGRSARARCFRVLDSVCRSAQALFGSSRERDESRVR
jgi:hypothetical protein